MDMSFDFKSMLESMLLGQLAKDNPDVAKIFNVFRKYGISIMDAMAMLMELATIAQEIQKKEGDEE